MVWVKKYAEDYWEGHSIDGYFPRFAELKRIILRDRNVKPRDIREEKYGMIGRDYMFMHAMGNGFHRWQDNYAEEHPEVMKEGGGRRVYRGTTDFYILKLRRGRKLKKMGKFDIDKEHYAHLDREWENERDKRNCRQILVYSHNRPETEDFMKYILNTLHFRMKEPKQYLDAEKFEEATKRLIDEEGFSVFVYPCNVVEERLTGLNFTCVRDIY